MGDLIIVRNRAHTVKYAYNDTLKSGTYRDISIVRIWQLMGEPKLRVILEKKMNTEIENRSQKIYESYQRELLEKFDDQDQVNSEALKKANKKLYLTIEDKFDPLTVANVLDNFASFVKG